jgi:hypothetical protein
MAETSTVARPAPASCRQRGVRSLSMIAARMPSRKSPCSIARAVKRYSSSSAPSIVSRPRTGGSGRPRRPWTAGCSAIASSVAVRETGPRRAQHVEDIAQAIAREMRVDLRLACGQRGFGGRGGGAVHRPPSRRSRSAPPSAPPTPPAARGSRRTPHRSRPRPHARRGHAEVFAQPPRRARQDQGAAHIRDQADPAFGHGDAGLCRRRSGARHGSPRHPPPMVKPCRKSPPAWGN